MNDVNWFTQTTSKLPTLIHNASFDGYDVQIGPYCIRLYLPQSAAYETFKEAFYAIAPAQINKVPDLTVYCIDASHQQLLPKPCWPKSQFNVFGDLNGLETHQHLRLNDEHHVLQAIDLQHRWGIYYCPQPSKLPGWASYAPLRELLHVYTLSKDLLLLHAGSLVNTAGQASLLLGKGGLGKSTATLLACELGYQSCGDDYVLVDPKQQTVYSLYRTVKWLPSTACILPPWLHQQPNRYDTSTGKTIYFVARENTPWCWQAPLTQLLILDRTQRSAAKVIPFEQALVQSAFSTITQAPARASKTLRLFRELVTQIPMTHIGMGQGQEALENTLRHLLENPVQTGEHHHETNAICCTPDL